MVTQEDSQIVTSPYEYDTLCNAGHFRFLLLQPAKYEEASIECSLVSCALDDAPEYDAISYTWGSPAGDYRLICDGQLLAITANLDAVMRRCRHQDEIRAIWYVTPSSSAGLHCQKAADWNLCPC